MLLSLAAGVFAGLLIVLERVVRRLERRVERVERAVPNLAPDAARQAAFDAMRAAPQFWGVVLVHHPETAPWTPAGRPWVTRWGWA